ncbi:MAG: tetratricopeptide repeat protein [bacterium]|nr:tetratricopeptide repeat protein [bacterium]
MIIRRTLLLSLLAVAVVGCSGNETPSTHELPVRGPGYEKADASFREGQALARRGWPEEAIAAYDRALAAGEHPGAHREKGAMLELLGHHERALRSYDRALVLDVADPAAHDGRARVLASLGREEEARQARERAAALR